MNLTTPNGFAGRGRAQMNALTQSAEMRWLEPGDRIVTPLGAPMYPESGLILPDHKAAAFMLRGSPVGVLILRPGASKLRYCDREGLMREEALQGDSMQELAMAGAKRMAQLIRENMGDRAHPLAGVPGNKLPA